MKYCTKRSKESNVEGVEDTMYVEGVCTDFNALNAMYVGDVGDGVCGFYATLYAEYRYHVGDVEDTLYTVAPRPARREGSL